MGVDVIATSLPQRVTAVADDCQGLADLDSLTGFNDECAGAEVGVVAEFAVLVLDGDEVSEAATVGVLSLAAIKGVHNAAPHRRDTAAAAQTDRSDIPGMETAAPMGSASVGGLGDHPLFTGGSGERVTLLALDEEAGWRALGTVGILDDDPILAWCEMRGVACGDVAWIYR